MCVIDGNRIAHIDPTHPSLRGFEIQYHWENVEEEDFSAGMRALVVSAFLGVLIIFVVVMMNAESAMSSPSNKPASGKKATTKSGGYR